MVTDECVCVFCRRKSFNLLNIFLVTPRECRKIDINVGSFPFRRPHKFIWCVATSLPLLLVPFFVLFILLCFAFSVWRALYATVRMLCLWFFSGRFSFSLLTCNACTYHLRLFFFPVVRIFFFWSSHSSVLSLEIDYAITYFPVGKWTDICRFVLDTHYLTTNLKPQQNSL